MTKATSTAVMAMTTRPRWPATARRSMAIGVRVSAVAPRSLCGSMLSPPSVPRPPRKNWTTRATRNSQATTRKALRASATARSFGDFAANEARRLLGEVMPEDEDSQAAEDVKRAQRHGIEVLVCPEGLEEDKEEKDDAETDQQPPQVADNREEQEDDANDGERVAEGLVRVH